MCDRARVRGSPTSGQDDVIEGEMFKQLGANAKEEEKDADDEEGTEGLRVERDRARLRP